VADPCLTPSFWRDGYPDRGEFRPRCGKPGGIFLAFNLGGPESVALKRHRSRDLCACCTGPSCSVFASLLKREYWKARSFNERFFRINWRAFGARFSVSGVSAGPLPQLGADPYLPSLSCVLRSSAICCFTASANGMQG